MLYFYEASHKATKYVRDIGNFKLSISGCIQVRSSHTGVMPSCGALCQDVWSNRLFVYFASGASVDLVEESIC